jgi:hypothetical protein
VSASSKLVLIGTGFLTIVLLQVVLVLVLEFVIVKIMSRLRKERRTNSISYTR